MDPEVEELQQDTGSLIPAVAAVLSAAAAYAATNKAVSDSLDAVDAAVGLSARLGGILSTIALRVVMAQIGQARSKAERMDLTLNAERAAGKATEDALKVVGMSVREVMSKHQQVMRSGGRVKISGPGKPFVDDVPGDSDDPNVLARRAAQTVRNSAIHNIWGFSPVTLRKRWHCVKDSRTRATHAFLGSPKYEYHTVGFNQQFITIAGNRLRFPGDPLAPIEETAHCRCWLTVYRGN